MSTLFTQSKQENITFSHSWTITDFSNQLASSVDHPCFNSCTFPSTSSIKSVNQFRLNLYPKGINANFCDYLSIGLGAVSVIGKGEKITVRYRVSLINNKGERRYTKEWLYIFSSSKRVSVFGRFIKKSDLLDASNELVLDDKLVLHCEGTVLGNPSALDYANTNLSDLKFITKSQPDLMVEMLYNLATKHRRTYYSPEGIPNFEIQNQVEETFSYSYKAKIYKGQYFTWSQSTYMKNTEELKLLSHREMLNLLSFWMVSGKHSDLSLVLQGDLEKVLNVHKIVLLNRSSSFDILLQQNSRVSIGDVPLEVFDQLIHYLYTGKVPLLKKYQYELLNVSNEYGFNILNQMSQLSICDELSNENVINTLIYANSVSVLKRACLEYITVHATKLMFELDLLKSELIEELYRNLALKTRLAESDHAYDQKVIANFEIQNQVDETFSYTLHDELLHVVSHSAWSNAKYNTRSTQELMKLSRGLMLDTLYYLMNSGDYGDLLLVLGEEEELSSLHSIVLFNRSSVFDALMHNNTIVTEEQTKRVSIADWSIEVFDQLIQYLYIGEVPLLKEYQYEMLNIACENGFDVLKQMCELSICDEITTENVINMLIFANQVSADLLKRTAFDYITDHATELMFELESLKPELIEEMYRNLAFKNSFKESEDRQVYENLQLKMVSYGIEESLSYTHLKKYHIFNEFTFTDFIDDYTFVYPFESPEFCAPENSSFKFKLTKLPPPGCQVYYLKHKDFGLMVKNDRRFEFSESQVSFIRYKMAMCLCLDNESYETLGTCDGCENFQVSSSYARVGTKLSLQNSSALDNFNPKRKCVFFPLFTRTQNYTPLAPFNIRSEITVLCGISALALSPVRALSQLGLGQSRKHLFECINALLLKCGDAKRDVALDIRGANLKAHKLFLTQSPVLLEELISRQSNRIFIPNLSIDALERLIHYLYTGKVILNKYYAKQLLIVANKFELEILVQMCQLVLNLLPAQWSANGTCRFKLKLG